MLDMKYVVSSFFFFFLFSVLCLQIEVMFS